MKLLLAQHPRNAIIASLQSVLYIPNPKIIAPNTAKGIIMKIFVFNPISRIR